MENHIDENNLDERGLLPYPVIEAAVNGSYEAVEMVLRSFELINDIVLRFIVVSGFH